MEQYQSRIENCYLTAALTTLHAKLRLHGQDASGGNLAEILRQQANETLEDLGQNVQDEVNKLKRSARSNRITKALQKNVGGLWRGFKFMETGTMQEADKGMKSFLRCARRYVPWIWNISESTPKWFSSLPMELIYLTVIYEWYFSVTSYRECSFHQCVESRERWMDVLTKEAEEGIFDTFATQVVPYMHFVHDIAHHSIFNSYISSSKYRTSSYNDNSKVHLKKSLQFLRSMLHYIRLSTVTSTEQRRILITRREKQVVEVISSCENFISAEESSYVEEPASSSAMEKNEVEFCGSSLNFCNNLLQVSQCDEQHKKAIVSSDVTYEQRTRSSGVADPDPRMFMDMCEVWNAIRVSTREAFQGMVEKHMEQNEESKEDYIERLLLTDSFKIIELHAKDLYQFLLALEIMFIDDFQTFRSVIGEIFHSKSDK